MNDIELYHYGVKGMKWGVRKNRASSSKSTKKSSNKTKSSTKKKIAKTAIKATEATAKAVGKMGEAYLVDQVFFDGMGTKMAKETTVAMGRAAVTAYTMARGGYDIKWYDEYGRRVG